MGPIFGSKYVYELSIFGNLFLSFNLILNCLKCFEEDTLSFERLNQIGVLTERASERS